MSDISKRIQNLSPARQRLLEQLNAGDARGVRSYPIAYSQLGMWFIDQLEPNTPLYNMPFGSRYKGGMDHAALWRAIGELIERHESLRTIFPTRNGVAVQEVLPELVDFGQTVDLSGIPIEEREAELERQIKAQTMTPFQLAKGPLFRAVLFRMDELDHVMYFNMHHIIGDGWSCYILERELDTLYQAYLNGAEASPLPKPQLQFGDYAIWQRGWLSGEVMTQQLAFWKEQLDGVEEATIPTDYPRPAVLAHQGHMLQTAYTAELSKDITEFCRRENATPFMVFLAMFQLALARYMGIDDFLIGTPTANRNRLETENIVGCLMNTIVIRSDLAAGLSFRQLVSRVRERTLSAYDHQEMPFERLVEKLVPVQTLSRTPLFQAMFTLQNYPSNKQIQDLEQAYVNIGMDMTKLEMTMSVDEHDGIYGCHFEYDADLFEPARMQRMLEYFGRLLEAMVTDPDADIANDLFLPDVEQQRAHDWGRQGGKPHDGVSVAQRFEQAAHQHADAVAVLTAEETLTYRQLNTRANQIARHLVEAGVGPEVRVGVLLERGANLCAAMLGVMKAGGVYMPLDPIFPEDRLAYMAEDSSLAVLLFDAPTRHLLAGGDWQRIDLDKVGEALQQLSGEDLPCRVEADHLAYIIYTSGSTGQPKGVGVPQQALLNQLHWVPTTFALSAQDRFLQKTSISFDASITEMLAPLVSGASLVVARPRGEYDPQYLTELVAEQGVTCVDLSPSLLDALLALVDPATWRQVRLIVCGGEALRPEQVRLFKEHFSARLVNCYGPTETAIQSAWSDQLNGPAIVPIGWPVAHTQLYVLDAQMQLAPAGTRGELFIGGIGLARGYLGHPSLTADKFVPNPFGKHGERLYRTGDKVRWRPDGQLEFLGRTDHQIKLRGYRIELSEIERAIESHAGVVQAIVVIREDQPGMQQLVAYVVNDTSAHPAPHVSELRVHVTKSLPTYMVPVAFIPLGAIPLMPNGKLDRGALPAPDQADFPARNFEPPQGETEQRVAAIFEEVLKLERVGRLDNFFELGGHSLLAVQLISRIQRGLDRQFRLMDLFTYPTVQQIAQVLDQAQAPQAKLPSLQQPTLRKQAPLSFAQQRLWFLNQIEGVGSAYNIPLGLVLTGRLDRAAARQALDHLLWRHESLRTTFPTVNELPVQSIAAASDSRFQLDEEDLRASTDPQAIRRRVEAEAGAGFDLVQGPLIRGRLIRTAKDEHVLLVTVHHIIADGWSIDLFWNDFGALYRAFQAGQPNPLPVLGYQYADYAQWQRQWLSGDVLAQQQDYWKKALGDAPAQLTLPTDRPRPAQQDFAGSFVSFGLDAELTTGLRRLSQSHGITLYMTLLAAWSVVLSRLSGQREVVIGTPTANRPMRELEELIGFFVNMLALRMEVPGTVSVSQLLTQARTTFLEAQEHEHLSFEQVVEVVRPPRDPAYSPIFQVMFNWHAQAGQGGGKGESILPGIAIRDVDMPAPRKAKFDLTLALEERATTIGGGLEYATALFERTTIERFLVYLQRVLQAMVRDPAQTISQLDMLPPAERSEVLHGWNKLAARNYVFEDAHRMIEAQARRTPEQVAVVHGADTLNYAQLNAQANQLARHLRAEGIGPDVRVGLCVERGTAMVVAMLAVLKAGGAYVPLDPAYPPARLQAMLADAAPAVVLTQSTLHAALDTWEGPYLDLDDGCAWADQPDDDLPAAESLAPEHLAYLIYTSGSTGTPKGVMLQRANLANFLCWGQEAFDRAMLAQTLAATSLSFDLAVFEILLPLSCGGTVQVVANVLELAKAPVPVTLVNTVPSALEVLLDEGMLPSTVRVVNLAGEALKPGLVKRVFAQSQVELVHNLYGPTETTTYSTYTRITREEIYDGHIGQPIANTRIYILDAQGEPVSVGVSGELYIGGAGVARGYYRREELTSERFRRDPFVPDGSARMYRTGDLARWRADGRIDYLGRADHQVKLRGYRIELGEIEQALERQATVRQAAVLMREDVPGHKQLVAYVVGQGEGDVATWRKLLRDVLPAYMVPAAFVVLEAMPLTPNGKLDRKALPAQDQSEAAALSYEPPQGETEQRLAAIFAEVLQVERVGRNDNFFELGGHSLLAVQLIGRIQRALDRQFRLMDLFTYPTVQQMAQVLDQGQGQAPQTKLPPLRQPTLRKQAPLSFAQQRLWFLNQFEGVGSTYNIPLGLVLTGRLERAAVQQALDHLLWRHEILRTTFPTVNELPVQSIAAASDSRFQLDEEDLRASTDPQAKSRCIDAEASAGFDLVQGPLIRGRLVRTADDEHVLLVTVHHIIADGWSISLFWNDFGALYGAFQAGQPNPLPVLGYQYADYAQWQRQWLSGDVLAQQQDYWKKALGDAPAQLTLPTDRPRPAQQDFTGGFVDFGLDAELTAGLRRLSQSHGITLYMTLLAAWSVVLSRLSGQREVVIGTPTANRPMRELEELIGFFVNMLALRMEVPGTVSVSQLLTQARTTFLEAQEHEHLSFEQVVEVVRPPRDPAYSPIFQVMFTWHAQGGKGGGGGELLLPGITACSLDIPPRRKAKFDLTLMLQEQGPTINGGLEYATALFDHSTVERVAIYLQRVLQAMVRDPAQAISQLDMLPAAERDLLLKTWNDTDAPYPAHLCIHQLFEQQVERVPDAIALRFEEQSFSYARLNAEANRLAHYLIEQGVRPDDRVAICLERSPAMVVGMLATLKAGGAYVPLDPAYPCTRLTQILADAGAVIVLSDARGRDALGEEALALLTVLDLAGEHAPWIVHADANPDPRKLGLSSEHLAYVIYTSGSTGTPKGVMVEHRNLANYFTATQATYYRPDGNGSPTSLSFAFDGSVTIFFGPLIAGQPLILLPVENEVMALGKRDVSAAPVGGAFELLKLTPAHLKILNPVLAASNADAPAHSLILGGEALVPGDLAFWQERYPQVQLINEYGPTETTIGCTTYVVSEKVHSNEIVPIGRPLANTRIYLLDPYGQPVPCGATGELHVGGAGVARGYLNRPDLTAERFLTDPFSPHPDARMYRTGDLARYLPDGNLVFLGRNDHQVKIRGFRIELGEIESHLTKHPGVRASVVLAREDMPGDKRLVAYIVPAQKGDGGTPVETDALVAVLRSYLSAQLPDYMVPAAFVTLDALPLTPNGKLDQRVLPAPGDSAFARSEYEPPRGEVETTLVRLWQELLGVERIGRNDNFFELGGHSLLAVQLVRRIGQLTAADFRLQNIFTLSTPASIAAWIAAASRGEYDESSHTSGVEGVVALTKDSERQPVFFVHPIGGTAFCYAELARLLEPQASVYALESDFDEEDDMLGMAELAEHYLKRLRQVQPIGPYRLAGWSFGGLLAWEMAAQLRAQGESVPQLVMIDTHPPQPFPPATSAQRMRRVISNVREDVLGQDDSVALDPLDLQGGLEALENLLVRLGLAAEVTRRQETAKLVATYDRNLYAMETYGVPSAEQMAMLFIAAEGEYADHLRDEWSRHTHGLLECIALEANHYTIMTGASTQAIAQRMLQDLSGIPANKPLALRQPAGQIVS